MREEIKRMFLIQLKKENTKATKLSLYKAYTSLKHIKLTDSLSRNLILEFKSIARNFSNRKEIDEWFKNKYQKELLCTLKFLISEMEYTNKNWL